MSNLYNLEPQPTAKVVLNTTSGDLTLELFAKQTPYASRNFLQHCLDGYYNNTIFHRLVPKFIIQGGGPTGTGHGGISAINDGEPFEDEFHSRLKFNRRGLLGMANEGKDNNGSQFFLTLDATPELQGKHTMFGRIEGDTIYNLMKMADAEMAEGEDSERPLYPTKVTGAEVLVNPFEDMVVRAREAPRTKDDGKKEAKKRKKPAGKNVLSFGAEEGEEEAAPMLKKTKANPKLVAVEAEEPEVIQKQTKMKKKEKMRRSEFDDAETVTREVAPLPSALASKRIEEHHESDEEESETEEDRRKRLLDKTNAEIAALKASMKRTVDDRPREKEKPKSALEAMIPNSSTRGRKRGKATDEQGAMDLFKAFKSRLEDLPAQVAPSTTNGISDNAATEDHDAVPTKTDAVDEEAELCDLHFIANCQSCRSWDQDKPDGDAHADGDDGPGWMSHTLTFAKDTLGKDLEWRKQLDQIDIIDPREKARTIKEENRKGKGKAKR